MSNEQRKDYRKPLSYPARIDRRNGSLPLPCLIRDVSASGAKVLVETADDIPDHFLLLLAKKNGALRDCRVVWRQGKQLGVEFLKPRMPKPAPRPRNSFKELMRIR